MMDFEKMNIGVLGAGAWGTAIAKIIAEKNCNVEIWSYEEEVTEEINSVHQNSRYLTGVNLPSNLKASSDIIQVVKNKEYIFIAIPSPYIIHSIKKIIHTLNISEGKSLIGILSKGFIKIKDNVRLIVDTLEDYLPGFYKGNLVYISGPSHAEEVARNKITGLISASANMRNSIKFRELLSGGKLIVFSSFDIIGVQVSAAVKNIIAIAFGMFDALRGLSSSFGDNTASLLLAAGINEIQSIGHALGSTHPETFTSIAGVGDLDVTCRSKYGRNRRFGREIILDRCLDRYSSINELIDDLSNIGYFPEGIYAAQCINTLIRQKKLKLPICNSVYKVLNHEADPLKETDNILRMIIKRAKLVSFNKNNIS